MLFHFRPRSILVPVPLDLLPIKILFRHCATEHVKVLVLIPLDPIL